MSGEARLMKEFRALAVEAEAVCKALREIPNGADIERPHLERMARVIQGLAELAARDGSEGGR